MTAALSDDNATSNAVKGYAEDKEISAVADAVVPFSSARKWSGAHIDGKSYVMGAPEFVFRGEGEKVAGITEGMAEQGLRLLVVAVSDSSFNGQNLPEGLQPLGMIFIADKIRKEAPIL